MSLTGIGQPNGIATLDANGRLPNSQLQTDVPLLDASGQQVFSGPMRFTGDVDLANLDMSASSADANGNYTVTTYTRPGGNKFMVSTLSGTMDSNGNYPTMTNVYYKTDGTTVDHTDTWTLTWDANSKLSASSVVRS